MRKMGSGVRGLPVEGSGSQAAVSIQEAQLLTRACAGRVLQGPERPGQDTPSPGCREWGLQPGWAGGASVPFCFLPAPWTVLFVSLQAPLCFFLWGDSWVQSSPSPPHPCLLRGGCSLVSSLRRVHGRRLSNWRPGPPSVNLKPQSRRVEISQAGAAASLCISVRGSAAQKVPMMGYQAAFLCSRHRSQLWLKENQRWVRAGGYPRGQGCSGCRTRPAEGRARAAWWGPGSRNRWTGLSRHPVGITQLPLYGGFLFLLFLNLFVLKYS